MEMLQNIAELEKFSPRRLANETKAQKFVERKLTECGVDFELQGFRNSIPEARKARLTVDGEDVLCMSTSFKSGIIEEKNLISSLAVSGRYYEEPNINFNPYADGFSLATFYRAPSLAIRRRDMQKVMNAETVRGEVVVSRKAHVCANIIAGNARSPKAVAICHYDSVLGGALDNSSGTAVLLELCRKGFWKDNMIVFSGCEELSFDTPIYWGKGYKELENDYKKELIKARRLLVVDMVGSSPPTTISDGNIKLAAFPVKDGRIFRKASIVSMSGNEWRRIYHSSEDVVANMDIRCLEATVKFVSAAMVGREHLPRAKRCNHLLGLRFRDAGIQPGEGARVGGLRQ